MKPLYLPKTRIYTYICTHEECSRGKVMMMTGYRLKKRTHARTHARALKRQTWI